MVDMSRPLDEMDSPEEPQQEIPSYTAQPVGPGLFDSIINFLKTKSPDKPVEDYINHPVNFDGTRGMAKMIRAASGFLGDLNYAIIDLVTGFWEWRFKEKDVNK